MSKVPYLYSLPCPLHPYCFCQFPHCCSCALYDAAGQLFCFICFCFVSTKFCNSLCLSLSCSLEVVTIFATNCLNWYCLQVAFAFICFQITTVTWHPCSTLCVHFCYTCVFTVCVWMCVTLHVDIWTFITIPTPRSLIRAPVVCCRIMLIATIPSLLVLLLDDFEITPLPLFCVTSGLGVVLSLQ